MKKRHDNVVSMLRRKLHGRCVQAVWILVGLVPGSTLFAASANAAEMQMDAPLSSPAEKAAAANGANNAGLFLPPTPAQLQAAFPDLGGMTMSGHMGAAYYGTVMVDRLEVQDADTHAALVWEANASWGRDFDKLTVSSKGEHVTGATAQQQTALFWSHALTRWWDGTLGLRHDGSDGPDRTWAAFGVQGLAPYFFHVDATAYAGAAGRSALRLDVRYDMRFGDRLILQPRLELNAYGTDDAENRTGKGLSDSEAGLRLRYEIRREIAPYLGVEWSRKYAGTADYARVAGERTGEARAVAGIRLWY
ncbi:MAG: copper resistance protein B [bacterium]|nr:copper resistance protein B [bacterium]